jgi:glycosyltransferase involved in cell wall biosynthesis
MAHLPGELIEVCLETADPISSGAIVVPLRIAAPGAKRWMRPPLRYVDQLALERAWLHVGREIRARQADVVFANPCRFLQAPAVLLEDIAPAVYFCDEPRRADYEEWGRRSRNCWTLPLYTPLYGRQRKLDRAATGMASRLATNSYYTAGEVERAYGRTAEVVRMGVAESLLEPRGRPPKARTAFVLSVGSLIVSKGHDLVLRAVAVASIKRPVVIVAPWAAPAEAARLQGLARALDVELTIRVAIPDAELRDLYETAHATLYLAGREPFGLVALEAQACGCPAIVSDEGGLPETIVDGVTGWRTSRDPAGVAALLDRLEDAALYARMSSAASEHASHWSWRASAAQIDNLLAEVLDVPHGATSLSIDAA